MLDDERTSLRKLYNRFCWKIFEVKFFIIVSVKNTLNGICTCPHTKPCYLGSGKVSNKDMVNEKSPQLDDGDSGFPPRDDDGGGGGGGGGGGNWSGFLKDKESEEDYRDNRRR
ncbi:hypothetical protein ES332_D11G232100v1 [Gossypium tomentosum]|uniref:Uncharacterized protein n=1 Tax=Gossypium tomentosum TaxID=34277 RepID=A0A5D2ISN8_GOSTO|nr:hypothetical protein ES332_D11G232100v1 [Gossypium tomentosum]